MKPHLFQALGTLKNLRSDTQHRSFMNFPPGYYEGLLIQYHYFFLPAFSAEGMFSKTPLFTAQVQQLQVLKPRMQDGNTTERLRESSSQIKFRLKSPPSNLPHFSDMRRKTIFSPLSHPYVPISQNCWVLDTSEVQEFFKQPPSLKISPRSAQHKFCTETASRAETEAHVTSWC